MRWDNLFDDLEGQLERELAADEADLALEEERMRLGRLTLRDRLAALLDGVPRSAEWSLRLALTTGEIVPLRPLALGRDWMSGDIRDGSLAGAQCVVPLEHVVGVLLDAAQLSTSLAPVEAPRAGSLASKLTVPFVLRDLARRRAAVELRMTSGAVTGTIDRVGRDHLDIAVHARSEPRRASSIVEHRIVPLAHLVMVRL